MLLRTELSKFAIVIATAFTLIITSVTASAGSREKAKRIHDRLAGVPASQAVLDDMVSDIDGIGDGSGTFDGTPAGAAYTAMQNSAFYNVTLKNFAMPWTNREFTVFAPLNDYVATFIGMVRDDVPMNQALSADILYIGSGGSIPAYSNSDNAHYEALDDQGVNLRDNLIQTTQSAVTGLDSSATAGLMTTRAAAKSFFIAGTNRAMFRFTMLNHLCHDMEQVADITRAPDRIRQDVSRSPGGDSRIFLNNCIGCHSGMDAMAQAFAYYDFAFDADNDPEAENGIMTYNGPGVVDEVTGTRVHSKYFNNNSNFDPGFVTLDDRWSNYWRAGQNKLLGWSDPSEAMRHGNGAKSLGEELANSEAYARCQVEKVFRAVCLRDPVDAGDRGQIDTMIGDFITSNYNLKQPFAQSALFCSGS
ncbi:MAG: hypothetical protein AAF434_14385 [Pseudomonadota bacterium]